MRLRRTHYAIAVMVVTTALAADRAAIATVQVRQAQPTRLASLAARLTSNLQRALPAVRVLPARSDALAEVKLPAIPAARPGVRVQVSPFQFRLPPPLR